MNKNKPVTIYLIRHGEAQSAWDEDPDPDLSEKGKEQSELLKEKLLPVLPSDFKAISSPLLRAQKTAIPLKNELGFEMSINDKFAEIPSPGIPLSERREWLKGIFNINTKNLEEPQMLWRNSIIESLKSLNNNTIIFSHFMVINCVVGWINNSEKFVSFYPDNCSITKIIRAEDNFKILNLGRDFSTTVQ
tara:strand:- start:405 stop:974 length:570 start_codon:yes stop_codon:yes gene_type:complete